MSGDLNVIQRIVVWALPVLLAITVHEVAHGWVAKKLGDPTAEMLGRLTLNPIKHIDPIGTVVLPLLMLWMGGFVFGWAKPVQFNPYALRKAPNTRAGIFVVASAGPLMNVLLAVLAAIPFRLGFISVRDLASSQPLAVILYTLLSINLVLAVFNLIPVPPLDGSKILAMLLPAQYDNVMAMLSQYGMFILLFMILPVFGGQSAVSLIMSPIVSALTRLLLGF